MTNDEAIEVLKKNYPDPCYSLLREAVDVAIEALSAQSETSRIENVLHGKSAEEQYDFIKWLLQSYIINFTDSRQAGIEWLRGKNN